MSIEDEGWLLRDQSAIKVLTLFPKRDASVVELNTQNYAPLFRLFTCTLCQKLMQNPAMLPCTHRFCQGCLEKQSGKGYKKCPTCPDEYYEDENVRSDESVNRLMKHLLGDTAKFTKNLPAIEAAPDQLQPQSSQRLSPPRASRSRLRAPLTSPPVLSPVRTRSNLEGSEQKKKSMLPSLRRTETAPHPQLQGAQAKETDASSRRMLKRSEVKKQKKEQTDMKSEEGDRVASQELIFPKRRRNRKSKGEVIEIESESGVEDSQQVEEIPKQVFEQERVEKGLTSIRMIPEVSEMESQSRMPSLQVLPAEKQDRPEPIEEERQEAEAGSDKTIVKQERMEEERDGMWARRILMSEWGSGYMEKLLEVSPFPIHMEVSLLKLPQSFFTPQIHPNTFKFSINLPVSGVQGVIGQSINIPADAIRLYTKADREKNMIPLSPHQQLREINLHLWHSYKGLDIVSFPSAVLAQPSQPAAVESKRVLYYVIDPSRIQF